MTKSDLTKERNILAFSHSNDGPYRESFEEGFDAAVALMEEKRVRPLREFVVSLSNGIMADGDHVDTSVAMNAELVLEQMPELE